MQTFDDLEKKWLDAHHEEYKHFTRLLLTFAIGAMTFLITFHHRHLAQQEKWPWMLFAALIGLLFSAASGLLIQHRLMHNFLERLEKARKLQEEAIKKGDETPIKIFQKPTLREQIYYKFQIWTFFGSFVLLILYALRNL
jgi:hypothetical protein